MKKIIILLSLLFVLSVGSGISQGGGAEYAFARPGAAGSAAAPMRLFRGEIHSHTEDSDGIGTVEEAYRWARDVSRLDFFAVTDHSDLGPGVQNNNPANFFHRQIPIAESFYEPGRFAALFGYEVSWFAADFWGHVNIINNRTDFFTRWGESLTDVYKAMAANPDAIGMFNHPSYNWGMFDGFAHWSPEIDSAMSLIEVHDACGEYAYRLALAMGWHVSPMWNDDAHWGNWGGSDPVSFVLAPSLTRENILEAFRKNRTYAASEPSLEIFYSINGEWMGARLDNPAALEIRVDVRTARPGGLTLIELVGEQGIIVASVRLAGVHAYQWRLSLPPTHAYYYVKVTGPNTSGITAPVWIKNRGAIEITGAKKGLVRNPADRSENAVTVSLRNNTGAALRNVRVDYYVSPIEGFDINSAVPVYTAEIGSLPPGGEAEATGFMAYIPGSRRVTAVVTGTDVYGVPYRAFTHVILSRLYITEILPRTSEFNGVANPFVYMQVYNNSNSELSLNGYKLRYFNSVGATAEELELHSWPLDGVTVAPASGAVIWFLPEHSAMTIEYFNEHFGTSLIRGKDIFIVWITPDKPRLPSGWAPAQFEIVKGDTVITRIQYNWGNNRNEVRLDRSVVFNYQNRFTQTQIRASANATPMPGSLNGSVMPRIIYN